MNDSISGFYITSSSNSGNSSSSSGGDCSEDKTAIRIRDLVVNEGKVKFKCGQDHVDIIDKQINLVNKDDGSYLRLLISSDDITKDDDGITITIPDEYNGLHAIFTFICYDSDSSILIKDIVIKDSQITYSSESNNVQIVNKQIFTIDKDTGEYSVLLINNDDISISDGNVIIDLGTDEYDDMHGIFTVIES